MNPVPVVLTGVALIAIPPVRRRIAPVTEAVVVGIGGIAGATFIGVRRTVEAAVKGPSTPDGSA